MIRISTQELTALCQRALIAAGAGSHDALVLARATVEAEQAGNPAVGVGHLFDYLDAYQKGRINSGACPDVRRAASAVIDVDADDGLAQSAFEAAFVDFVDASREAGLAALWIRRSYTCGELGYYARRLGQEGLITLASANSPALMSLGGSPQRVLGTNPLAYGIPRPGLLPMVIDQASSSTAFVNIRRAAAAGHSIPEGWALGPDGEHTKDAGAALQGTLLPFGGHRGGNIALLVEILATLSGASFSMDAAPFERGSTPPGIGVFLLAIDPTNFSGAVGRLSKQLDTLQHEHHVRIPALDLTDLPDEVDIDPETLQRLQRTTEAK